MGEIPFMIHEIKQINHQLNVLSTFRNGLNIIYEIMIVHICTANRYHLTPNISKGYIKNYSQFEHVIILYGDKQTDRQLYIDMFKELEFEDFHFCTNNIEFAKLLRRYRNQPIVFHGENYFRFILAILNSCKNINWVCWGSGASISETAKSKLSAPIKRIIYKKINSIVTLMDQDRDSIIKHFNVNPEKIRTIPYATGNIDKLQGLFLELLKEEKIINNKPLVLLGNNSGCMTDYIKLLDILKQYSGKILVQCMLHYDLVKNEIYNTLVEKGKSIFGDDFKTNEEFYSDTSDYIKYMSKCDIYICGAMNQTGLGAIGTTLKLGTKIFLNGKNYEWMNSIGVKVFKVEEIDNSMTFDSFIKPLTIEEKMFNYERMVETVEKNPEKWVKYFNEILDYTGK